LGLAGWRQRRRWHRTRVVALRLGDNNVFNVPTATAQDFVHGGACVGRKVKPVRNLDCVGCTLPATLGICACSIADDDFDARVLAEPIREHVGRAIVE